MQTSSIVSSFKIVQFTFSIPSPLRRGKVCPYFQKGDDTMYEHEVDELLYETDSEWQNLKIFKTPKFGNMLCLDDVISKYLLLRHCFVKRCPKLTQNSKT